MYTHTLSLLYRAKGSASALLVDVVTRRISPTIACVRVPRCGRYNTEKFVEVGSIFLFNCLLEFEPSVFTPTWTTDPQEVVYRYSMGDWTREVLVEWRATELLASSKREGGEDGHKVGEVAVYG